MIDATHQIEQQARFTPARKLHALAFRFYQGDTSWRPAAGDFYTLTRAGVELFQITRIENEQVYICNCLNAPGQEQENGFPLEGFTTAGFGINRVHTPGWLLDIPTERL